MLDYKILNTKGIVKRMIDGKKEEYYDLLSKNTKYQDYQLDINNAYDIIIVNEYYVGRADLISLAIYGDDKYADFICKYNGISNPFEINENDLILLPDPYMMENIVEKEELSSEFIEDSNEIIRTKKYKFQKEKDEKRNPGDSVVGEENYIIDKSLGIIIY